MRLPHGWLRKPSRQQIGLLLDFSDLDVPEGDLSSMILQANVPFLGFGETFPGSKLACRHLLVPILTPNVILRNFLPVEPVGSFTVDHPNPNSVPSFRMNFFLPLDRDRIEGI